MSNEREEGLTALQSGDFPTAQARLEAAIQQDPQDGKAYLYLGGVYHQTGRSRDAVQVLTRATELLPTSAQARYNLGIVLEHLNASAEALGAYQQALALQPSYPLAQQGLERMRKAALAPPAIPQAPAYAQPQYAPPGVGVPQQPAAAYNPVPAPQPYPAVPSQPYAATQPPQAGLYAQPQAAPQQPAYGQPQLTDLAGNPLPNAQAAYGQPNSGMPSPGYAPGGPAGPAGYRGPQWSPNAVQAVASKEDAFSVGQAFTDFFALLMSPRSFFEEEEGAEGFSAPLAMLLVYSLIGAISFAVGKIGSNSVQALGGLILGIPLLYIMYIIIVFIWAGLVHGVSRIFSGSGTYSGTFRAVVYAWAPMIVIGVISMIINLVSGTKPPLPATRIQPQGTIVQAQYSQPYSPRASMPGSYGGPSTGSPYGGQPFGGMRTNRTFGGPNTATYGSPYGSPTYRQSMAVGNAMPNPIVMVLNLIGLVWSLVLLGMGLQATQRMSIGGAIGTVIGSGIVLIVICVGLSFLLAGVLMAALSGMH